MKFIFSDSSEPLIDFHSLCFIFSRSLALWSRIKRLGLVQFENSSQIYEIVMKERKKQNPSSLKLEAASPRRDSRFRLLLLTLACALHMYTTQDVDPSEKKDWRHSHTTAAVITNVCFLRSCQSHSWQLIGNPSPGTGLAKC